MLICELKSKSLAVELIKPACLGFISTLVMSLQPREASSSEIEPIPAKRSKTDKLDKSKRCSKILKRASLAKSVVGLTSKFFGAEIFLPFQTPEMIRYILMN